MKNGNEKEYLNNLKIKRENALATLDSQSKRNAFIAQYNAIVALGPVRYSRILRRLNDINLYSKNGLPLRETFMKIWKKTQVRQKNLNNKNNNYFAYLNKVFFEQNDTENEVLSERNSPGPSTEPLPNPYSNRTEPHQYQRLNQSKGDENSFLSTLEDVDMDLQQRRNMLKYGNEFGVKPMVEEVW